MKILHSPLRDTSKKNTQRYTETAENNSNGREQDGEGVAGTFFGYFS